MFRVYEMRGAMAGYLRVLSDSDWAKMPPESRATYSPVGEPFETEAAAMAFVRAATGVSGGRGREGSHSSQHHAPPPPPPLRSHG
jgi:hypothetical protein